jgi:Flp pilus assembly protein TadD
LTTEGHADPIRSSLLSGLAILSYEAKDYGRAADLHTEALQHSPQNALVAINLAITLCTLGRNQEALALAGKAIKLNGRDARVWNALGYVYLAMGKVDDAIKCFTTAAGYAPRIAAYHSTLAICYDLVERPDDTRRELELAHTLATDQAAVFLDIYESALLENTSKSLARARAAVRAGKLSPPELWRDPNLSLLMDSSQLHGI